MRLSNDGIVFDLHSDHDNRRDADDVARELRKRGFYARVTPRNDAPGWFAVMYADGRKRNA